MIPKSVTVQILVIFVRGSTPCVDTFGLDAWSLSHFALTSQFYFSKIWGFHGSDYEEWRLLGYKTPVRTSQETHYVSATQLSQLMLRKIWGFHGDEYEEWRLLGYKTQVRTSQETQYVSATESSQLMLCKIWGFHGGTTKNAVFWDITTQFVLHRRHITSPLQSPES
jgi:hypothetical protein